MSEPLTDAELEFLRRVSYLALGACGCLACDTTESVAERQAAGELMPRLLAEVRRLREIEARATDYFRAKFNPLAETNGPRAAILKLLDAAKVWPNGIDASRMPYRGERGPMNRRRLEIVTHLRTMARFHAEGDGEDGRAWAHEYTNAADTIEGGK